MKLRRASGETLILVLILAAGAALRLYGLNWDGGHWLHPDERQIYFLTAGLGWPQSLAEALNPDSSLNPGFFAYGSLPFYLLRLVAGLAAPFWPPFQDPDNLHLLGRPLAALFDLGTVYLTYRLARSLWPPSGQRGIGKWGALLVATLVSLAVLHVQLAHFYTTDPLLACFVLLTLNLAADIAQGGGRRRQAALGIAVGLALATKVTAALLIAVVFAAYSARTRLTDHAPRFTFHASRLTPHKSPNLSPIPLLTTIRPMIPTLLIAVLVFVAVQPYALIDWQTFLNDTIRESQIAWGRLDVPYTRQYAGTLPYLYSMWQTALWGLALPLGLIAWASLAFILSRWLRRGQWSDALLLGWTGPYLAITGLLYARYLRYMLPLVPLLCLSVVGSLAHLSGRRVRHVVYWVLGIGSLAYALGFVSIYAEPHSWVTASEWIYREVPTGSTLAVEEWDIPLPLALEVDGQARRIDEYDLRTLPLYDEPDDIVKWEALAADLAGSDYLVVASRRLYGSIPCLPDRYPVATRYYEQLFAGELGFGLVGEFTRGPTWLNPRLPPLPDAAPALLHPDESFVVYDHPRALIFRNMQRFSADELLLRLQ